MKTHENNKAATLAKDITRARAQLELIFQAMEAMGSKKGRVPTSAFADVIREDPGLKFFSFACAVSEPRAFLNAFLHWADCHGDTAPMASKAREHLDRILEYAVKADCVLSNPPTDESLCSGDETSGWAVRDWGLFWAYLQDAIDFLRACENTVCDGRVVRPVTTSNTTESDRNAVTTNLAKNLMEELRITRPQAKRIILAMIDMGATAPETAKHESEILSTACVKSRIVSVFSAHSDLAENYAVFRKRYIKNDGTHKGMYFLKLS